jgi:predicted component of type VI protein secretion system
MVPPVVRSTPPPATPWPGAGPSEAERLLTTFAESYLPATVQLNGAEDLQAFLGKLAETIEAFARAFVEMRKGYEEFGKQMGIRTTHGEGPVQRARDPRQLLAALLDPAQQGRTSDLQASFADYMVHQVALLNGVVEGAKAILGRVSPEAIEAASPGSMWPMKAQALWKAFEGRYQELVEEESTISDALFGREFGKAYTAIVGQKGAIDREEDDDEDEDEEDERPKKKKRPPPRRR